MKEGFNDLALKSLGSIYDASTAGHQIEKLINAQESSESTQSIRDFTYWEILTCKKEAAKSSRLGFFLHFFQQISGINALLYYSSLLYEEVAAGFMARVLTIIACFCRLAAVFILFPIIDKSGRKKVTVIAEFGMGLCFLLIALLMGVNDVEFTFVIFTILYLMCFAISMGPICWIYSSEILNDKGMALCTSINWGTCFITVLAFPFLLEYFGTRNTFFLFSGFNIIGSIYFCIDMVEIKGMTRIEIRELLSSMR